MTRTGTLSFREGGPSDLRATFELAERTWEASQKAAEPFPTGHRRLEADRNAVWARERPLLEFIAAQPGGRYWICEADHRIVGYARAARFGAMDEMTELWVDPAYARRGAARELLSRCWPGPPTRELGRVVVTLGLPVDLSLYTGFGVMPVSGHWHLRHRVEDYLERRALELDSTEPGIHLLKPETAIEEWKRLEPAAIGHERPQLHEFFGRTRVCLALMTAERGRAAGLCWISPDGDIGPAVGESPEHLVPLVLAALDRVAKAHEPEHLGVFCTTDSWWLLDRLRRLGFRVYWPRWVMCSVPLPGLNRYLPTRPPLLL